MNDQAGTDPEDRFEDALAALLGLDRPQGTTLNSWRRLRVERIDEAGGRADQFYELAAARARVVLSDTNLALGGICD